MIAQPHANINPVRGGNVLCTCDLHSAVVRGKETQTVKMSGLVFKNGASKLTHGMKTCRSTGGNECL